MGQPNDVSFTQKNGSQILYKWHVVLPKRQNNMSFCTLNDYSFPCKRHVIFPRQRKMTCRFPLSSTLHLKVFWPICPYSKPGNPTRLKNTLPDIVLTRSNRRIAINPITLWFMTSNFSKKNWKYENPNLKHKRL